VPLAGISFVIVGFTALRVLNHLTMSIPFPWVDNELAELDTLLGLDWLAYAEWVSHRPLLITAFQFAYAGLTLVALVVFMILCLLGRVDRAKEFVCLVLYTGVIATLVGAMFPAKAAMDRFASSSLQAMFGVDAGIYFIPYLDVLRSHAPYVFNLQELPGLVTIPSFHAACGILIVYSCRGMRFLLLLAILYASVMIASTPLIGGHYFVDLIAGALLAVAVVVVNVKIATSTAKTMGVDLSVRAAG
jgi:hypothetical protein